MEEVFARLRALLRRIGSGTPAGGEWSDPSGEWSQALGPDGRRIAETVARAHDGQIVTAGDLRIDPLARRAWRGTRELELTRTEFDLLELLARNTGIVLDHSTIYDRIWGYDFGPGSKNLPVYVGYLRRKTEEPGRPALIQTERGVGYVL